VSAALAELQRWLQDEIERPPGPRPAAGRRRIEREVRASASLTACERLEVVAAMVRARLADCLADDYPGLRHAVGERAFEELARAYLARHPSTHYSLNALGRRMPEFLREARPREPFLAQLAGLERAVQEVFDAPQEPPLSADAVLAVPPARWSRLRLRTIAALELVASDYPVRAYLQAVHEGRRPARPRRARSWTLVHRRELVVWRSDLDADRWELLAALRAGETVEGAIARALARRGARRRRIAGELAGWFGGWAADGLFAAAVESD
jgi:hypothetical protein